MTGYVDTRRCERDGCAGWAKWTLSPIAWSAAQWEPLAYCDDHYRAFIAPDPMRILGTLFLDPIHREVG